MEPALILRDPSSAHANKAGPDLSVIKVCILLWWSNKQKSKQATHFGHQAFTNEQRTNAKRLASNWKNTCIWIRPAYITKYSQTIKYLFDNVIKGKLLRIFIFDFVPDINECLQSPCVHGQCSNTQGSYTCTCEPGWTGVNCQTGKGVKTTV